MYIAKSTCILLTTAATIATIAEAFSPSSIISGGIDQHHVTSNTHTNAHAHAQHAGIMFTCINTHNKGESSVCDRLTANHNRRLPLHLHMSTISEIDIDIDSSSVSVSVSSSASLTQQLQLQNGNMNTRTATSNSNNINRKKKKKNSGRISIDFESNTSANDSTNTRAKTNTNAIISTGKKAIPSSPSIEILPMASMTNQSRNRNQNKNPITSSFESYGHNNLRLTKQEEIELCQSIQDLKAIMQTRDQLTMELANAHKEHEHAHEDTTNKNNLIAIAKPFLPTPTQEEWELACNNNNNQSISIPQLNLKLQHGKESRAKLVSYNLGLVLQIAKRYDYELKKSIQGGGGNGVGTILTLSDLIQEGNMGLLEAAERFDAGRGVRFATYAGYWVKQRILRAITENSRVIRLPAHGELVTKLRKLH